VKLSLPVAHEIRVWHNGQIVPITKFVNNNEVEITLPTKVTSGPLRVEYQGKRLEANQPNKDIEIKPIDISGHWKPYKNPVNASEYSINQNGTTFVITTTSPTWGTHTYNGEILEGNIMRFYTGGGANGYMECVLNKVDPHGRATEMTTTDSGFIMVRK